MRLAILFLPTLLSGALFLAGCDTDEEAELVVPEGSGNGNGGGGGGGGGSESGLIDPNTIDITSEGIFSCDGDGTDFVVYDSTSMQSQILSTNTQTVSLCQFMNFEDDPTLVQVQMYGMSIAGTDATQQEMDTYFTPGNRPYSLAVGTTPGAFISIVRDQSDMGTWYQSNLAPQPSSSYFTITDAQGWMDGSIYKVKVRAIFQCEMRSVSGSNTMECVDGIFVGDFTSDHI